MSYFRTRYTDLIDFEPELFTNVNRSRVIARGVEADVRMPLASSIGLQANLTYLKTERPAGTLPLRSRPEWQGLVAVDWHSTEQLTWYGSVGYTSDFFGSSVPTGLVTMRSSVELGASARYQINEAVSITVSARHQLSGSYEDSVGFRVPDTVVRGSLVLRL